MSTIKSIVLYQSIVYICPQISRMESIEEQIKEFKQYKIEGTPSEIINHYKKDLQAIQDTLDLVAGRWKMQIIALLCNCEFRYSELEKGLSKISPRMLSKELKDLEEHKIIIRKVHDSTPVKVTYKLTDYGYTLVPLILELTRWGKQHRAHIMQP